MPARSTSTAPRAVDAPARARILEAAFAAFTERGFAETTTLEIATRARVSKRSLYTEVGTKLDVLVACITDRARRLKMPADIPEPRDRATLERALTTFGALLLREVGDPIVVSAFRLGIAEAVRTPEVGQALQSIGREPIQVALVQLLAHAQTNGLLAGDPSEMAEQFMGLLWGSLLLNLLLGVAIQPDTREISRRASRAAVALLLLNSLPASTTR